MMKFSSRIAECMVLCEQHGYEFIGQGVRAGGHSLETALRGVDNAKKLEFPVSEDLQTGFAFGAAMTGRKIVSIYPRFDFFLLGFNQLVNHVDKYPLMIDFDSNLSIIYRVGVGAKVPLDAGPQHTNNYSSQLRTMCRSIRVVDFLGSVDPLPYYAEATLNGGVWVMVEHHGEANSDIRA